jgi:hypothetical protein
LPQESHGPICLVQGKRSLARVERVGIRQSRRGVLGQACGYAQAGHDGRAQAFGGRVHAAQCCGYQAAVRAGRLLLVQCHGLP